MNDEQIRRKHGRKGTISYGMERKRMPWTTQRMSSKNFKIKLRQGWIHEAAIAPCTCESEGRDPMKTVPHDLHVVFRGVGEFWKKMRPLQGVLFIERWEAEPWMTRMRYPEYGVHRVTDTRIGGNDSGPQTSV